MMSDALSASSCRGVHGHERRPPRQSAAPRCTGGGATLRAWATTVLNASRARQAAASESPPSSLPFFLAAHLRPDHRRPTSSNTQWWKEMGQTATWFSMLTYGLAPVAAATLLAFAVLWIAHARALKFAGTSLREHRTYAKLSTLALLVLGYLVSAASIDTWTVVRYAGSRGLGAGRRRLARPGLRPAALLLPVRPALLFRAARLRPGAG